MMEGPASAKRFVSEYLASDLPTRVAKYRNHWGIAEEFLTKPNSYLSYAAPSLEHMTQDPPTCYTMIATSPGMTRIDYDEHLNPVYRVNYSARTYVWVRQEGMEQATVSRDNLMTVVRAALLDHQCLADADTENLGVKFDEGTMREEYSDLVPAKGDRWWAGGYISYTMTIDETITRDFIGEVDEIQVSTYRFLEEE